MLKRSQVLLTDWLEEYIKYIAETFDWSFSETIRLMLAIEIISWVSAMSSKYPTKITNKELVKKFNRYVKTPKVLEEELHRELSKIYFEARKATEFVISHQAFKKARSLNYKLKKT